jgi:hypothetical protein
MKCNGYDVWKGGGMTPDELRARVEEIREDVRHGYALPAELDTTRLTWAEGLAIALKRQAQLLAEIARLEGEVHEAHDGDCWRGHDAEGYPCVFDGCRDDSPHQHLLTGACPICRKLIGGKP